MNTIDFDLDETEYFDILNTPIFEFESNAELTTTDKVLPPLSFTGSADGPEYFKSFSSEVVCKKTDSSKRQRFRWSEDNDKVLRELCLQNPSKDWEFISMHFPFHTKKQVRRHYYELMKNKKPKVLAKPQVPPTWPLAKSDPPKLPADTVSGKLEFLDRLKKRVSSLENQLEDSSTRIRDIIKKYSSK